MFGSKVLNETIKDTAPSVNISGTSFPSLFCPKCSDQHSIPLCGVTFLLGVCLYLCCSAQWDGGYGRVTYDSCRYAGPWNMPALHWCWKSKYLSDLGTGSCHLSPRLGTAGRVERFSWWKPSVDILRASFHSILWSFPSLQMTTAFLDTHGTSSPLPWHLGHLAPPQPRADRTLPWHCSFIHKLWHWDELGFLFELCYLLAGDLEPVLSLWSQFHHLQHTTNRNPYQQLVAVWKVLYAVPSKQKLSKYELLLELRGSWRKNLSCPQKRSD